MMKKSLKIMIALVLAAAFVTAALPAAAVSFAPNGTGWEPEEVINVKKADPADVVKDGVISDGEYERYYPDLDIDVNNTSPLFLVYFNNASFDAACSMFASMEYYFSWDETHGFNFAVRNKPAVIQQLLDISTEGPCPQDDFARNTAYVLNFWTDDGDTCLFYALGRRTDTGEYLEGWYNTTSWLQSGAQHNYPESEKEYIITYGDDGYVTLEWSIPLENFFVAGGGPGSVIQGTISATAGTASTPFGNAHEEDSYAVALGDYGYGVDSRAMHNQVSYLLLDEAVKKGPAIEFTDVPEGEYYAAPVSWAVSKGITTGTSATTFSPDDPCTRGQVVTFLWRAAGCPEPKTENNPFRDVKEEDYFYKAVLWALEGNVTMGTGDYSFSPDEPCTRAQIVTFLWRYEGKPVGAPGKAIFSDVSNRDYYYAAVYWAAANEITLGTSPSAFSPDAICTRAQVVTFLYRDMAK